uniref:HTH cro/C1-type domain-containing protein n=1 Tax=Fundidesulfovibrio putealis TaxID=270496 RepID=A0A7C4AFT4_9BACT
MAKESLPESAANALVKLGQDIRAARIRRRITAQELARRALTSRLSITRLENGHPGVSLGILAHVLWVLELEANLGAVADPQNDRLGTLLAVDKLPRTARRKREDDALYDF